MISKFFINRPRFATVIAVIIVLAGILAIYRLPVEEYPKLTPPRVTVSARYPGADAQTILKTVAAPLEEAINGVKNMLYIQSTASYGALSISVYFKVGTNPDIAKIDVSNRVQNVLGRLPEVVRRLGVEVRERSPDILKVYAFYSKKNRSIISLTNYVNVNVLDAIKRVKGVGDAIIFGDKFYSIRVWLNPAKLAAYSLTPEDVYKAIQLQNEEFSAGSIANQPTSDKYAFTYIVQGEGRLKTVQQFKNIVLKMLPNGGALRLGDVAKVELGGESYAVDSFYNGKPTVPLAVFAAPGANALAVSKAVDKTLKSLSKNFPKDITYANAYDPTKFIRASIDEVVNTLIVALILVVIVVYIFLGNIRATIIPVLAIPVSIIGTFAGFYLFGFSINLLTLFGLVLAIGLVVDDAIIVIENIERVARERNLPIKEAAIEAMNEISPAIIAIVLVLSAVFIPAAFVGGFSGKMFQQFAVTLSISMFLSGFVALTLTPALCVVFLKGEIKPSRVIAWFQKFFDWLTEKFSKTVRFMIKIAIVNVAIYVGVIVAIAFMARSLPKALVPPEDKGSIFIMTYLMPGSNLKRTERVVHNLERFLLSKPYVKSELSVAGLDLASFGIQPNAAITFVKLTDWSKRKGFRMSSIYLSHVLMFQLMRNKNAMIFAFNPPPIMGMSMTGGFDAYIQNRKGDSLQTFAANIERFVEAANKSGVLMGVRTTLQANTPSFKVTVDKDKAYALGVNEADIYRTISMIFGKTYVNDINLYGKTFHVNIEGLENYRASPIDYNYVYVRSKSWDLIPVISLIHVKRTTTATTLQRFNMFEAAKIMGQPAPGYTTGEAMEELKKLVKRYLPRGYTLEWAGSSLEEKIAQKKGNITLLFSLVFVFLILVALYESWMSPLAILLTVPFGILGAVGGLYALHLENDIYMQVGIITLIGLAAKNAILIVEFAEERLKKMGLIDAVVEASRIRFRPIVMTSVAFIAGSFSLVLSKGAGAIARHIIGITVVSGMLVLTLIGVLFIPVLYYLTAKIRGTK